MATNRVPSECDPGEKWDRCVADVILKTGISLANGRKITVVVFAEQVSDS